MIVDLAAAALDDQTQVTRRKKVTESFFTQYRGPPRLRTFSGHHV